MREFLRGLELDKETIDTIMAEIGKNHQGLKEQIEDYKTKCSNYEDEIKSLSGKIESNAKSLENLQNLLSKDENILIISGDGDPVGAMAKGPRNLANMYRKLGVKNVKLHIYAHMRHEIHNEDKKDVVYSDILYWINK